MAVFRVERNKGYALLTLETGEKIRTPRGTFSVTDVSREQIEAAGYGVHHQSAD